MDEYEYDDDFFEDGSEDDDAGQFGPPEKYLNQKRSNSFNCGQNGQKSQDNSDDDGQFNFKGDGYMYDTKSSSDSVSATGGVTIDAGFSTCGGSITIF